MARRMLKAKGLPNQFWGDAVAKIVYLLNISPTRAVLNQTPFEAFRGQKAWVSHLKIFSCVAYALVNSHSKLYEKSEKCIFIGYSPQSKAYRLYNPISGKVIISRNVVFNEEAWLSWNVNKEGIANQVPANFDVKQPEFPSPASLNSPSSASLTPSSR